MSVEFRYRRYRASGVSGPSPCAHSVTPRSQIPTGNSLTLIASCLRRRGGGRVWRASLPGVFCSLDGAKFWRCLGCASVVVHAAAAAGWWGGMESGARSPELLVSFGCEPLDQKYGKWYTVARTTSKFWLWTVGPKVWKVVHGRQNY